MGFGGPIRIGMGGGIEDVLREIAMDDDGEEHPDGDYVEEKTTKDGRHIHKEVHQEGGMKMVKMTVEGGMPPPMMGGFGGDPMGGLIGAMMGDLMQQMGPGHHKQAQK